MDQILKLEPEHDLRLESDWNNFVVGSAVGECNSPAVVDSAADAKHVELSGKEDAVAFGAEGGAI